jgi:hypothetical protein
MAQRQRKFSANAMGKNTAASHINRLLSFYRRVLGRLTFIALKIEEQV